MLVDEQNVVFEAGVQVGFQAEMHHHGIVVTVDVRIHPVHTLVDLSHQTGERFGEGNACSGFPNVSTCHRRQCYSL